MGVYVLTPYYKDPSCTRLGPTLLLITSFYCNHLQTVSSWGSGLPLRNFGGERSQPIVAPTLQMHMLMASPTGSR